MVEASEKSQRLTGTQPLGKTALFKSANGPKNDTYQRVLRASPIQSPGEARIACIASGLAPENEIITFQPVANALTSAVDEISRINLGKSEAADVDVAPVTDNGHMLAYCTDDAIFLQKLPNTKGSRIENPVCIYQDPESTDSTPSAQRPRFRAIRILTPKHILFMQNRPGRSGAGLGILRLNQDDSEGRVTFWKKLRKSTKSAVGLDVCALTESERGQKQFIIAVAAQDSSIEFLTINRTPSGFGPFNPYTHLRNVHPGPITKITFSNFIGPSLPISPDTPPQSVRLASVGIDRNIVVHYLPLRPNPDITKSSRPGYFLVPPGRSDTAEVTFSVFVAIIVAVIVAFLVQCFCEIRGAVPPTLGSPNWLSPAWRESIYRPYNDPQSWNRTIPTTPSEEKMPEALSSAINAIVDAPSQIPLPPPPPSTIVDSLSAAIEENSKLETPKAIVMRAEEDGDLSAELHHDVESVKEEEALKKWEDLSPHQQRSWKRRLSEAGHWAEEQGETVFKGILFSGLAAAMG